MGRGSRRGAALFLAFWLVLLGAAAFYLYRAFDYVAVSEPQPGATWLSRQLWYFAHIVIALPVFALAPLQFTAALRQARPRTHRILGRTFLVASILAGLSAVYLGATIHTEGSRLPLSLFGILWVAFSVMAWVCARRGDFAGHRLFVIRSFAIALAFVWIRFLDNFQDDFFWFVAPGEVRDATREWASLVIPLLVVEAWLSWGPVLRRSLSAPRGRRADLASAAPRAT